MTSKVARGSIRRFVLEDARAVPGVLDILTYENVGDQADPPPPHGPGDETTTMQDARIWHAGQIIAVVTADSCEAAREAALKVGVDYDEEAPAATFGSPGVVEEQRKPGEHKDFAVGDAEAAFMAAPVQVDARYGTPTQHHNPIELFSTTAVWHDGSLTLYEPSQFVHGLRGAVAKQLHMDPRRIRVVARHVGGAFGSKGIPSSRTAWIAIAARRLGRAVKFRGDTGPVLHDRHLSRRDAASCPPRPPSGPADLRPFATRVGKSPRGHRTTTCPAPRPRRGCMRAPTS